MTRIGVVGSNSWNGHPFSYSACINGWRARNTELCPFPIIQGYIRNIPKNGFPEFQNHSVVLSCDQTIEKAKAVASFSKIPMAVSDLSDHHQGIDSIFFLRDDFDSADYRDALVELVSFADSTSSPVQIFFDKGCPYRKELGLEDFERFPSLYPTKFSDLVDHLSVLLHDSAVDGENIHIEAFVPRGFSEYGPHVILPLEKYLRLEDVLYLKDVLADGNRRSASIICAWGRFTVRVRENLTSNTPVGFKFHSEKKGQDVLLIPWVDYLPSFRRMLNSVLQNDSDRSIWDEQLLQESS